MVYKLIYISILFVSNSLLFSNDNVRDCPDNFVLNPDYPVNGPECFPQQFSYNSSSQQSFYYFNFVTIDGLNIQQEDWVGAFFNDVCIGSKQWNLDLCSGDVCDIPIMGNDGSQLTQGYISSGLYPTFKIYDYSENLYFDAIPSSDEPWYDLSFVIIDSLSSLSLNSGCTDIQACNYDENSDLDDGSCWYSNEGCNCDFPQGYTLDDCGVCSLPINLETFDYHEFEFNGSITAQILVNGQQNGSENDMLISLVEDEIRGYVYGSLFPLSGLIQFPIMIYSNQTSEEIISFKYYHASSNQFFCLDETINFSNNMMVGNGFNPFTFNINEEFILGCTSENACNYNSFANFDNGSCLYAQQFFDCNGLCLNDIDGDSICDELDLCNGLNNIDDDGDGICNDIDVCIGFDNIDDDNDGICNDYDPCFGFDNIDLDENGICNDEEIFGCTDIYACNFNPDATQNSECYYIIDCAGVCNGNSFIDVCGECVQEGTNPGECLDSEINIPQRLFLSQNYPNPFNPITTIDYEIPENDIIKIEIFNLNGRKIKTLQNTFHLAGYYSKSFSSNDMNSGVYLLKISSSKFTHSKKITILK